MLCRSSRTREHGQEGPPGAKRTGRNPTAPQPGEHPYTYDPSRRWLNTIQTIVGGTTEQALEYTRNKNGQVSTRTSNGDTREHLYDPLNRLVGTMETPSGGSPQTIAYEYDAIGNLILRGATPITPDATRPHLIDTAGANTYGYDQNANVTHRTGPDIPGGAQTITYTTFDLPRSITTGSGGTAKQTLFEYTPDEERLVRRDGDTVRHFVSDLYQRAVDPQTGDTQEETFRLYAGDREIEEIVRQNGTDETLYFHTDELGSVDTISTVTGPVVRQAFDDFGAAIDSGSNLTRAGYTGHQHDADLGLIDMRGRIYDTLTARFTTADPVASDPFWSQGLNRFAYVFNDPTNVVDPSGFWEIAAGNAGGAYIYGGFSGLDALGLGATAVNIGLGIASLPGATPSSTHTVPAGIAGAKNTQATTAGNKATDLNNGQVGPPVGGGDSLSRIEPSPRCKADPNAIGCGFDPLYALDFIPVPLGAAEKTGAWALEKLFGRLFARLFGSTARKVAVDLAAHEAAGGHLIAKHVGRTAKELAVHLAEEAELRAASTFSSLDEATTAASKVLTANEAKIAAWVEKGAKGNLPLDAAFNGGQVLVRGAKETVEGTGARLVLKGTSEGSWYILTGFPTP